MFSRGWLSKCRGWKEEGRREERERDQIMINVGNSVSGKASLRHMKGKNKSVPSKGNRYFKGPTVILVQLRNRQWFRGRNGQWFSGWNGNDNGGSGTR